MTEVTLYWDVSEDQAPVSARAQRSVLRPEEWAAWLYLTKPEAELLRPLTKGSLKVQTARQGGD